MDAVCDVTQLTCAKVSSCSYTHPGAWVSATMCATDATAVSDDKKGAKLGSLAVTHRHGGRERGTFTTLAQLCDVWLWQHPTVCAGSTRSTSKGRPVCEREAGSVGHKWLLLRPWTLLLLGDMTVTVAK